MGYEKVQGLVKKKDICFKCCTRRTPFNSSETAIMTGEQRYSQNALHSAALLMVDDAVTVYVLLDDQI